MRKLLPLLFLPAFAQAQNTFQKQYDFGYDAYGIVQVLPDSSYAITGSLAQVPGERPLLVKLDAVGQVQWSKAYSLGSGMQGAMFPNGTLLSNGGFLLTESVSTDGLTNSTRYTQTDAAGNVVYTAFEKFQPSNHEIITDQIQTSDGYIVAVSSSYMGPTFVSPGFSIIKSDTLGNLIWNIAVETDTVTTKESPFDIMESADGNYLVCGRSFNPVNGSMDCYVIKVDPSGNVLWKKMYGNFNYDLATSIGELSDGTLLICGITSTATFTGSFIFKTDAGGNLLWTKTFASALTNDFFVQLLVKSDHEIIVYGQSGLNTTVPFLVSLDSSATVQWARYYPLPGTAGPYNAKLTLDNGIIFTGALTDTVNGEIDLYLIKTDSIGKSDCLGTVFSFATSIIPFTELPYGWVVSGGSWIPDSTSSANHFAVVTMLCPEPNTIHEQEAHASVSFPNPVSGAFELHCDKAIVKFSICSSNGQSISEQPADRTERITIDAPADAGFYLLTIYFADGTVTTRKLVVARN